MLILQLLNDMISFPGGNIQNEMKWKKKFEAKKNNFNEIGSQRIYKSH